MDQIRVYFSAEVPPGLKKSITLPEGVQVVEKQENASVILGKTPKEKVYSIPVSYWRYVTAAPFPRKSIDPKLLCDTLLATQDTVSAFFGTSPHALQCGAFLPVESNDLLSTVSSTEGSYALIPFEDLSKTWQLRDDNGYIEGGNIIQFSLSGDQEAVDALIMHEDFSTPASNFNPQKLSSVILTGTTALTRGTGKLMDEKGSLYPAESIGELLSSADITHISNEVSFDPGCDLERSGTKFCSKPQYFDLLKAIGTDIIELTGNHELDYGSEPFINTLDLYDQNDLPFYGGGKDLPEAARSVKIETNGNRIAFLGCNSVGPKYNMAKEKFPGSNPCDAERLKGTIEELNREGYNAIVTFQHMEVCQPEPLGPQRGDFQRAADAGATIVSGSQGHCPQVMEFRGDTVIHYGLGNLFFDQMNKIERMAFLDRYWFYDNRLIGVEPIAIIRDDEAQPRLMTAAESAWFLEKYLTPLGTP
jgi:poly-gamma-glutamate synthesis protein (capsule biosynthesis protein)